ncbi:MAG: hypothetical protein H0W64_04670 [Gammaproteobacteria bacterium]|nr:hypothetical protein [Gammaproteobacteria bacterium]
MSSYWEMYGLTSETETTHNIDHLLSKKKQEDIKAEHFILMLRSKDTLAGALELQIHQKKNQVVHNLILKKNIFNFFTCNFHRHHSSQAVSTERVRLKFKSVQDAAEFQDFLISHAVEPATMQVRKDGTLKINLSRDNKLLVMQVIHQQYPFNEKLKLIIQDFFNKKSFAAQEVHDKNFFFSTEVSQSNSSPCLTH